jgi:hypothetical protein
VHVAHEVFVLAADGAAHGQGPVSGE